MEYGSGLESRVKGLRFPTTGGLYADIFGTYWVYMGLMEKKMETTTMGDIGRALGFVQSLGLIAPEQPCTKQTLFCFGFCGISRSSTAH